MPESNGEQSCRCINRSDLLRSWFAGVRGRVHFFVPRLFIASNLSDYRNIEKYRDGSVEMRFRFRLRYFYNFHVIATTDARGRRNRRLASSRISRRSLEESIFFNSSDHTISRLRVLTSFGTVHFFHPHVFFVASSLFDSRNIDKHRDGSIEVWFRFGCDNFLLTAISFPGTLRRSNVRRTFRDYRIYRRRFNPSRSMLFLWSVG